MTVLQNPVIPIVVRWSAREGSLRVENRRPAESIRPDRLAHTERACAVLDKRLPPILRPLLHETMTDQRARSLVARIQHVANLVTEETDVLFVAALETDADRDAQDRNAQVSTAREDYDKAIHVTAGELRAAGWDIDAKVPDDAWVRRSAIDGKNITERWRKYVLEVL